MQLPALSIYNFLLLASVQLTANGQGRYYDNVVKASRGHRIRAGDSARSKSLLSKVLLRAPALMQQVASTSQLGATTSSSSSTTLPTTTSPPTFTHYEFETNLVKTLFKGREYNPQVRPAKSDDKPVEVSVELVLLQISDMVEKDQEVIVSGFIKIKWRDVRLIWDPEKHGGIDWIVTESTNCWLPDLALINSNDVYSVTRDTRFPLTINRTGDILYVPAGKIVARCELNLRFFPFDHQLCKYRFESWAYASELVLIKGQHFTIEQQHYIQNPEWQIPDAFVKTEIIRYEGYNFSRVDFYMLLKRKSLFFITYTIFPCIALSVLQLLSHTLPFTEPERINFATTTLIAFSVFHVSIVEQMPHSSDSIPLLAIFVDSLMCLIGLSLVECFLMANWLSRVGLTVPSPRAWYYIVDKWGDYMWLGAAGNYWRRNFIYVYERLNHKLEAEHRRREFECQCWATMDLQYHMRQSSKSFSANKDAANFQALVLMAHKISSSPRQTVAFPRTGVRSTAFELSQPREPLSASQNVLEGEGRPLLRNSRGKNYRATVHENDDATSWSNESLCDAHRRSSTSSIWSKHKHETEKRASASSKSSSSSKFAKFSSPRSSAEQKKVPRKKAKRRNSRGHVNRGCTSCGEEAPTSAKRPTATGDKAQTSSDAMELKTMHSGEDDEAVEGDEGLGHRRNQTQSSIRMIDAPSQSPTVSPSQSLTRQRKSTGRASDNAGTHRLARKSSDNHYGHCDHCGLSYGSESTEVRSTTEIRNMVEEVRTHISNNELRKECIGIWTTYITVIDRILSIFLCLLSVSTLSYLFVVFPQNPDPSDVRRAAGLDA